MPEVFISDKKEKAVLREVDRLKNDGRFSSPWSSMQVAPDKAKFESQNPDENLLLIMRAHPLTNVGWLAVTCLGLVVPFFWGEFPFFASLGLNATIALGLAWYGFLLFYAVQRAVLWFYNIYIVTDERLIDVDFMSLLFKNINVTQIHNIEEVNYSIKGMIQSFYNYGNVVVQTASEGRSEEVYSKGELSAFTFESVPNPDEVVKIISELMEEEDQEFERRR